VISDNCLADSSLQAAFSPAQKWIMIDCQLKNQYYRFKASREDPVLLILVEISDTLFGLKTSIIS
jgi:hypothetical protein